MTFVGDGGDAEPCEFNIADKQASGCRLHYAAESSSECSISGTVWSRATDSGTLATRPQWGCLCLQSTASHSFSWLRLLWHSLQRDPCHNPSIPHNRWRTPNSHRHGTSTARPMTSARGLRGLAHLLHTAWPLSALGNLNAGCRAELLF